MSECDQLSTSILDKFAKELESTIDVFPLFCGKEDSPFSSDIESDDDTSDTNENQNGDTSPNDKENVIPQHIAKENPTLEKISKKPTTTATKKENSPCAKKPCECLCNNGNVTINVSVTIYKSQVA